jgi:SAM-dependent methyltransferase
VARKNLEGMKNVQFHSASVATSGIPLVSQDFGYSLGVLHHVPDTAAAIRSCAALLKPGAPLLLYLYYAFDNRLWWFRALWQVSDWGRRVISRLPVGLKHFVTDLIAVAIYWPLARLAMVIEKLGATVDSLPLSHYRSHSFYTMRTDSRDRFGTPLEHRFTKAQIETMMGSAGFVDICFSSSPPFWCVVGRKACE